MRFNRSPLNIAITFLAGTAGLAAPSALLAQSGTEIPVIQVTALGVDENAALIVAPFSVLDAKQTFMRGGNLGDLLNGLPGVHSDSFGGGASRPVVRGQTSPRLKVLSDSGSILDASDISPDHAISADPLLAQQVEVLRGPATLLYGGGAIGGVVNILDGKIPTEVPDGLESFVAVRGNTVADERAGAVNLTARATDNIALHVEGSLRETDDYEVDGWEESTVHGTASESRNSALGASWVGESGFIGLAYSYRDDDYGLPGHNHEYEECHPHGIELHCEGHEAEEGHDHEHEEHDHEEVPVVALESRRMDLRAEYLGPVPGIHRIRVRGSHTDYEHNEIEEGVVGTTFRNEGYEGRIDIDHAPVMGWHGIVGVQFADTRFSSVGAESFIPVTDSKMHGVFAVEHLELSDSWHLEAGARYEKQTYDPVRDVRARPKYDESAMSWSAASIWSLTEETSIAATFARAQRLAQPQELYARGIHLATNTYECGLVNHPLTCGGLQNNASIDKETSNNLDISLRKHTGDFTYSLNLFHNSVDGYIFARTLDQYEDFRLIKYTQRDATLKGLEAEFSYAFNDNLSATVFGDYLTADLDGADKLPRISPQRVGVRGNYLVNNIETEVELYRVSKQDDVAAFETETAGYTMANVSLSYSFPADARFSVFVRGSNLLDEQIWSHTSFLASVIPMPGRNLSAGFRMNF
jgi:iron complex outermembrane receptor protein